MTSVRDRSSLEGKVAVVTGALGKLGPIWSDALLWAGAVVIGLDRVDDPSEAWSALGGVHGGDRIHLLRADVRSADELQSALEEITRRFGSPDILVNNAGIDAPPGSAGGRLVEDVPFEENREIFEVNTLGAFLCAQIFGSRMVASGGGSIINIGSLYAGVSPDPRMYDHIPSDPPFLKPPAYGASKAALLNLTRYLAVLWGGKGVRVNALSPGGVLGGQDPEFRQKFSGQVPMGRMALPEDLGGPLVFLASDAASYVTGQELLVDGGYTLR